MSRTPATTYTIDPQRNSGSGWVACQFHQARRFAVIEVKTFIRCKQRVYTRRMLNHHLTHAEAQAEIQRLTRVAKPLPKPSLGQRFQRTGRDIIARGIGRNLSKPLP